MLKYFARLEYKGNKYDIQSLNGFEEINKPYKFDIEIKVPRAIDFISAIGDKAMLYLGDEPKVRRNLPAIIQKIKIKRDLCYQYICLTIAHPLAKMCLAQSNKHYYQCNSVEAISQVFSINDIAFRLLDIQIEQFEPQAYLHQSPYINDLEFVKELLAIDGLNMYIEKQGKVVLYQRNTRLPKSVYDELIYLASVDTSVTEAFHYVSDLKRTPKGLSISGTNLRQLEAATLIELSAPEQYQLNGCYRITRLNHHINKNTLAYHYKAHLVPSLQKCSKVAQSNLRATSFGQIMAYNKRACIDPLGRYYYDLKDRPLSSGELAQQMPIKRLHALAGINLQGIHFPLKHEDQILLAYLDGKSNQPYILASFYHDDQLLPNYNHKSYQSIMSSSSQMQLVFNDHHKQSYICLQAGNSLIKFNEAKDQQGVEITTSGSNAFKAEYDIQLHVEQFNFKVHHNTIIEAAQSVDIQAGDYHAEINQKIAIDCQSYQSLSGYLWQFESDDISFNVSEKVDMHTTEDDLQIAANQNVIILEADNFNPISQSIIFGTPGSFIRLSPHKIEVMAKSMDMIEANSINYRGMINILSKPKKIPADKIHSIPPFYKIHSNAENKESEVVGLQWSAGKALAGERVKALFQIKGYAKGDYGKVTIYRCSIHDSKKIQVGSLLKPNNDEQLQLIEEIPFCVGEKSLYTRQSDAEQSPGDALIHVIWQPKTLSATDENAIVYYRFAVELLEEKTLMLSNAMQWFGRVQIQHRGVSDVRYIKVIRNQLEGLSQGKRVQNYVCQGQQSLIEDIPLGASNIFQLIDEDDQVLELISADNHSVEPYYQVVIPYSKDIVTHQIYSLPPCIILNWRSIEFAKAKVQRQISGLDKLAFNATAMEAETDRLFLSPQPEQRPYLNHKIDKHARLLLTERELKYFQKNGNNITIFIHGFNVGYGRFPNYLYPEASPLPKEKNFFDSILELDFFDGPVFLNKDQRPIKIFKSKFSRTVKKDFQSLSNGLHLSKEQMKSIDALNSKDYFFKKHKGKSWFSYHYNYPNGDDMHAWILNMEDNLNRAAGFSKDYRQFTRAVFIAWPGDPEFVGDYMTANKKSHLMGRALADLLKQVRDFDSQMEINLIAHSQGNGMLVSALNYLFENHAGVKVDNVFLWQAAIPNNTLDGVNTRASSPLLMNHTQKKEVLRKQKNRFWYLPYAHLTAKKITVLHSNNDNIVGPIIEQDKQPMGLNEAKVFQNKPLDELIPALLTTYLGLDSLYGAANALAIPVSDLYQESNLDKAYQQWYQLQAEKQLSFNQPDGNTQSFELYDNLDQQYRSMLKEDAFHQFFVVLAKRINNHRARLKSKLNYLPFGRSIVYQLIESLAYYLLQSLAWGSRNNRMVYDQIEQLNQTNYRQGQLTEIRAQAAKTYPDLVEYIEHLFYSHYQYKLVTFLYCAECSSAKNNIPSGMGWYGVDDNTIDMLGKKLDVINTSKWLYHHSDMLVPSNDLMDNVYIERILKKIKFGGYQ